MKKITEYWSIILLCAFALFIMYNSSTVAEKAKQEVEQYKLQLDSLQKINDSLCGEILPLEIQIGRYEVALAILKDENPKAANQYETIMSEKTE